MPWGVLWVYDLLNPLFLKTSEQGSLTALFAATSKAVEEKGLRGEYIVPPGKVGCVVRLAGEGGRRKNLWEVSEMVLRERGFSLPPLERDISD